MTEKEAVENERGLHLSIAEPHQMKFYGSYKKLIAFQMLTEKGLDKN